MQATTNVTITVARGVFPPSLPPYTFSVPELSPAGAFVVASTVTSRAAHLGFPDPGTFVGNLTGYSLNDGPNLSYTISPSIYYATFPFTVVSVPGPGGSIVGSVYTTATGATALSFGAGPNPYLTTCTVFNNNPVSPMSAFASVSINVSWVARPPRFGSGSTAPGSAWFQLEVSSIGRRLWVFACSCPRRVAIVLCRSMSRLRPGHPFYLLVAQAQSLRRRKTPGRRSSTTGSASPLPLQTGSISTLSAATCP